MVATFLAAVDHEMARNRLDGAFAVSEIAVRTMPLEPQLMLAHGVLLLHKQQVQAARELLLRASNSAPDSAAVWKFLGFADYLSDRTNDAIRSWKKSLTLAPDGEVQRMLDRALRETTAEARHQQAYSGHFSLRFEGRQVTPEFRAEILEVLERHFQELNRWFDAPLREAIAVILYTDQAFRDVTRAPAWAGAVNDGRLRIPVDGLAAVTPELSQVLKHELVHSFVWSKTRGRCPTWLNEGLAQYFEGWRASNDRRLIEAWTAGTRVPWPLLEGSFMGLNPGAAALAYGQSLLGVEYLATRFGMHEVMRLLDRLAAGESSRAALQSVYRFDYAAMEQGITQFLARRP